MLFIINNLWKLNGKLGLLAPKGLTSIHLAHSARKGELRRLSTLWSTGNQIACLKVTEKAIITGSPGIPGVIAIWDRSILERSALNKYTGISCCHDNSRNK